MNGNLEVKEWTVGTGSAAATPVGVIWNGGAVSEVAIAELDSATVIVAASLPDDNDLEITTLGIDSAGVHYQDQYVLKGIAGGGLYPSIAIGAGTEVTSTVVDGLPSLKIVRSAFTPIVTSGNTIDVIDWSISQTGKISLVRQKGNDDDYSFATAACMLPTLVPISAYYDQSGVNSIVNVGWYEGGMETDFIAVSGLGTTGWNLVGRQLGHQLQCVEPERGLQRVLRHGNADLLRNGTRREGADPNVVVSSHAAALRLGARSQTGAGAPLAPVPRSGRLLPVAGPVAQRDRTSRS